MQNGFTDITTIAYTGATEISKDDINKIQILIEADAPPFDIILLPCRNRNPSDLVDEFVKKVKPFSYKNVWLTPYFAEDKQCSWENRDQSQNCEILNNLLLEFKKRFIYPGIAT